MAELLFLTIIFRTISPPNIRLKIAAAYGRIIPILSWKSFRSLQTMNELKLKNIKQEYNGRCRIIPCCDLPKIEDEFNDLKEEIIDAFWKVK